ncbi:uncharacterized protein LOC144179435 isoform X1 [Haemaphysalis longicornis]
MDNFAIPFPTGRTTVGKLQGGRDAASDHGTDAETVSRKPMHLTIRSVMNNSTVVEAFATDSVLDLKLALQERLYFSVDQMLLVHRYQALVDSDTLGESGITDGSVIGLILRMRGGDPTPVAIDETAPIQLSIKIRRGQCVVVDTSLGQSVGSVKLSIEQQTGVPVSQQVLVFSGEDLSDENTLAHYQLRDRCALRFEQDSSDSPKTVPVAAEVVRPVEEAPVTDLWGLVSQAVRNLFF